MIDKVNFVFTVLAGITGFLTLLFVVWQHFSSRKVKIYANSNLVLGQNGAFVSEIAVLNQSQRAVEIQAIRFNIFVWDQSPKLQVHGMLKFQRAIDLLCERQATWYFPSDAALTDDSNRLPYHLNNYQTILVKIDLEKMIEEYFNYGEGGHFENKLFFWLSMRFLAFTVETSVGKRFKFRAHREISHYLYAKYKNDPRILAYPPVKSLTNR